MRCVRTSGEVIWNVLAVAARGRHLIMCGHCRGGFPLASRRRVSGGRTCINDAAIEGGTFSKPVFMDDL